MWLCIQYVCHECALFLYKVISFISELSLHVVTYLIFSITDEEVYSYVFGCAKKLSN